MTAPADGTKRKVQACPVCGKAAAHEHRPFCGPRCKAIDLHRWLGEVYRVPAPSAAPEPDSGSAEKPEE